MRDELIDEALEAHQAALAAQERLTEAARDRDEAIRNALQRGVGAQELATALGLSRQRVYTMAKQVK